MLVSWLGVSELFDWAGLRNYGRGLNTVSVDVTPEGARELGDVGRNPWRVVITPGRFHSVCD